MNRQSSTPSPRNGTRRGRDCPRHTQTIPIVMANSTDPVGTGFVVSLARPGRNITGNSSMSPELNGKRLELLKEVVPGLSRVAILRNPDIRGAVFDYKESEGAARRAPAPSIYPSSSRPSSSS
jgi:ABC-type uncharacterized transport system substrate-binding protein